ncbi:MAG: ArsR/SmtB family transcription factor [bacterium]
MKYKIQLDNSICYDFLTCLARVENNERYTSLKTDKDLFEWYESIEEKFPDKIKSLIDLYFHKEYPFGTMLTGLVKRSKAKTIYQLLEELKSTSPEFLLKRFIYIGLKDKVNINLNELEDLVSSDLNTVSFINENTIFSDKEKWQILQLIMNKEKIKNELDFLLRWFYENIYKSKEEQILEKITEYKKDLNERIELYGDEYIQLLMPFDYVHKKEDVLTLSLSHHYENFGMFNTYDRVFVYGYKYFASVENEHAILAGKQLFKALSDETRLNILRLLSKRPWYGNEIAEKLNISNSTVTHHMATLILNNLVSSYRQEYRIYFKLDPKKIKDIVNITLDSIIE